MKFEDLHDSTVSIYDSQAGKTAVVMGNGPSLRDAPREFLRKYPTFGSNRVYLLDGFRPSYYVCVNPLVLEQNRREIEALDCPKFLREGMGFRDCYELHSVGLPLFSYNPAAWVYEGHTVTFVALQLAFFFGFTTVLLVGVDHRYAFTGGPNERQRMAGEDPNHFSPEYFRGQEWHTPDLARAEGAYRLAQEAYEAAGRKIFNLTEGSALEVFRRRRIEKW